MLLMVGATAYVTLRSAAEDEHKLALQLHREAAANIRLQLDEALRREPALARQRLRLAALLRSLPVARYGQALLVDKDGGLLARSTEAPSPEGELAVDLLRRQGPTADALQEGHVFHFSHVTRKPLARTSWLAVAQSYEGPPPGLRWTVLTLLPESYFLAGVQAGNSRSALIFSLALLLSVMLAAVLASAMTGDLRQIARATRALAQGDLSRSAPGSRIAELDAMARSFNDTAQKLAISVRELRASEERMRVSMQFIDTLMDSLPGMVLLYDPAGKLDKWNRGLEQASGFSAAEIGGMDPFDLLEADQVPRVEASVSKVLHEGRDELELLLRSKDGRAMPYYFKSVRLDTAEGPRVLSVGLDISDRRRLEGQFQQAQKMEAVGNLAGGIAHDFNNLLTVIYSCTEVIKGELAADSPLQADLDEIHNASRSASELTRRLLALSRKQLVRPELIDMNARVRDTEKLLRRVIGEDIKLELAVDPAPALCRADAGQVEQAILNLALNARDAMPQGGTLSLSSSRVAIDEAYCREHPQAKPGLYVRVSLSDSGEGMSPEVLARIYEPFFTTKGPGKGTGLGLPMVYGSVQQSGGFMTVRSSPGQGTRFDLHFPQAEGAQRESAGAGAQAAAAERGHERILLVEDEPVVRQKTEQALLALGYQVLGAKDGQEALELASAQAQPFDLLVTDVVMPRLSGPAVAAALQRRDPGLKVLFISGHTDDAALRHGLQQGSVELLPKPFSPSELTAKVRAILDRT